MRVLPFPRLTTALQLALVCLVACAPGLHAAHRSGPVPHPLPTVEPAPPGKLNVLILGDSLALCGFGKRLDERFRNDPRVNATFTYMTCGTNPLSWLKEKPYTHVKTQCGFWTIESRQNTEPLEQEDVYGMTTGHVPKAHLVPKLDDLIAALHPDVLIMQTGSNLFGLFPDAKTVKPAKHAGALAKYLIPFKEQAIGAASNVRKMYWVNPPTSGRAGAAVQNFVFEQATQQLAPEALVIDSRALVSYPYEHMEPDKEHFLGAQMDEWADKVYAIIDRDLSAQPIASLRPLSETHGAAQPAQVAQPTPARAQPVQPIQIARAQPATPEDLAARAQPVVPVETPPPMPFEQPTAEPQTTELPQPAEPPRDETLLVRGRLVFKSEPMQLQELLPYRESLVAYVYDVEKVLKGQYGESQILVMHPAHLGTKAQRLKYRIGKRYKLRLDRLEGTLWETAKTRDESGRINLQPYIRVEDLKRHPEHRTR